MITRMYDRKDFQQSKGWENKQQYMYVGLQLKDTATIMAGKQWNVICRQFGQQVLTMTNLLSEY